MKVLHLIKVRFDKRRVDITDEWLEKRFDFFINHTLRSLENQTFLSWTLWVNAQPGMQEIIGKLAEKLSQVECRLTILYSFGDGPPSLPPEVKERYAYVYVTRIDSDDLFAPDAMALIDDRVPAVYGQVEGLLFRRGYLHDLKTGRVGVYHNPSPPFHTIMFPMGIFTDPNAYAKVWHKIGDHSRVNGALDCQVLSEYKFTVLVHDSNFLSTFDYGRESGQVPQGWTIDQFLNPPVIFDVDDFSDQYGGVETLRCIDRLKEAYPYFKCTLFGIPNKMSSALYSDACRYSSYVELALHGRNHEPNEELKTISPNELDHFLTNVAALGGVTLGFRPPGWYITKEHCKVLASHGYWVALHKRDAGLTRYCKSGYYICEDRFPSWHGHTHDVCGNYLRTALPGLLKKWPREQKFGFVSEAVLVHSR